MMLPELYIDARATLGESPAWDAKTQTLYWVDVFERHIYAGAKRILQLDDYIGCLAPRRNGGLILAQRRGLRLVLPDMKTIQKLSSPRGEALHNRFNDGKCDPRGRFIAGTMDHNEKEDSGALYSLSFLSLGNPWPMAACLGLFALAFWIPQTITGRSDSAGEN